MLSVISQILTRRLFAHLTHFLGLSMLARPENVVYFFRQVVGVPSVTQEVLKQRTADYQGWVEAYARKQRIPL
jgi:hypothetical protein